MTTYNALTEGCYGDGAHDDTSTIQSLIDSLTSADKLYLPAGTYLLSSPGLALGSDCCIYGDGTTSVLYFPDDGEYRVILGLDTVDNVSISDMKIMSDLPGTSSKVRGIQSQGGATSITLRSLTFDYLEYGIKIDGTGNSGWDVDEVSMPEGTTSQGVRMPIFMQGTTNSTFRDMSLWANSVETGDHHFYIANGCSNLAFTNIECIGGVGHVFHLYGATEESPSSDITFTNVRIINPAWYGIHINEYYTRCVFNGVYGTCTSMGGAAWIQFYGATSSNLVTDFLFKTTGGGTSYFLFNQVAAGNTPNTISNGKMYNSRISGDGLYNAEDAPALVIANVSVSESGPPAASRTETFLAPNRSKSLRLSSRPKRFTMQRETAFTLGARYGRTWHAH